MIKRSRGTEKRSDDCLWKKIVREKVGNFAKQETSTQKIYEQLVKKVSYFTFLLFVSSFS
jgi:hypothetical protein